MSISNQSRRHVIVVIGFVLVLAYLVGYGLVRSTLLLKRQRITLVDTTGGGFVSGPQQTVVLSGVGEGGPRFTPFNQRLGYWAEVVFAPLCRLELACW